MHPGTPQGLMDNLRRFPAPWTMEERKDGFQVKDASGFFICGVSHREDLHRNGYQYAHQFLSREEARRIAKAISRLSEQLKRPQY
ncbi:hypothetical protein [Bradyrhizobium liaoningense]|uniref:hypothetical protein n=1 Tax=Bradyrhizobium liaoningense TaxID=43992 RepID=UPI00289A3C04|nr:hypothetical protein [Bradyrhizobium liaoningense]